MLARIPIVALFAAALFGAALGLHADDTTRAVVAVVAIAVSAAGIARAQVPGARGLAVLSVSLGAGVLSGVADASLHAAVLRALPAEDDVVVIEALVLDARDADRGRRLTARLSGLLNDDVATPAAGVVTLSLFVDADVRPGDVIRARGRLRRPAPALSPGTFDAALAARARAVHATLAISDALDVAVFSRGRPPLLVQARELLRARLRAHVPDRLAGLLLALLIGDTSLFEPEQDAAYRHVGAGHLLAVSGLQVTLLAVVLRRICGAIVVASPAGRRRYGLLAAAAATLVGVWAFVGLCGTPPSAVRAGVMASVVVLAGVLGRRVRLVDAVAAAGLLTVLVSPSSVDDAGFLLSYTAVLALAATSVERPLDDSAPGSLRAAWRTFRPSLVASLTAGLATLPISATLFGQVAPAGLVANIVLVPVASALQLPALLCGALGAVLDVHQLTWLGAQAALLLEALVYGLAELLPGVRAIEPPSWTVSTALLGLSLLGGALAMAERRRAVGAVAAVAGVIVGWTSFEPRALRVTFLPVGQGDGAVVELPGGEIMVVDAGGRVPFDRRTSDQGFADALAEPGLRVVVPFLERRGVRQVDVLVASHPHPDHVGGLVPVARAFGVGALWLAGDADAPGRLMRPLIEEVGRTRVRSTPDLLGVHTFSEGATVEVLAPAPAERTATYGELHANDNSLVLRVCWHEQCVLLPGDLEAMGEELLLESEAGGRVRAAVVKAAHHGSNTSSTPSFVAATGARHVVMCTGRHNTFGFPNPEVVARWRAAGATVWDTAVHGEVRVVVHADGVDVRGFRP